MIEEIVSLRRPVEERLAVTTNRLVPSVISKKSK